jgi:hypothetical protein
MSRLCIIPCGTAKIWDKNPNAGPTEAQYVCTGVFAAACQRYAMANFDYWVILSAIWFQKDNGAIQYRSII